MGTSLKSKNLVPHYSLNVAFVLLKRFSTFINRVFKTVVWKQVAPAHHFNAWIVHISGVSALSQDKPDIKEILITVKQLLESIANKSKGSERYDALCGAFLIGVVDRELDYGEPQNERQSRELQILLGREGSIHDLYQQFCQQVRHGKLDEHWPAAFNFALRQVVDKVSVTNPDYLTTIHRTKS